ncbi:MAG: ABC transporter permease [Rhodanobacteraceae bacterium]|nr:MAG: ABC transporter permease [Rhodanobacteraceae bacterium]
MDTALVVAAKEYRDDFRSRWTLVVASLFVVLALAIAYFGGAAGGKVGFMPFDATLASLTTLAAFVVPLIGLLLAYDMVVGERDQGTLLLVLSYPISRIKLVTGKFLGHCGALATATVAGFGAATVIILAMQPATRSAYALFHLGNFMVSACLLGACFVALGGVVSVATRDKARAAGLALLVWLATVVVFDLCLLAILVLSGGNPLERWLFPRLLYLNPVDVFRLINLATLGAGSGNQLFMGMTAGQAYPMWSLYAAALLWVLIPAGLAQFIFRREEV